MLRATMLLQATWAMSCSDVEVKDSLSAPDLLCDYRPRSANLHKVGTLFICLVGAPQVHLTHSVVAALLAASPPGGQRSGASHGHVAGAQGASEVQLSINWLARDAVVCATAKVFCSCCRVSMHDLPMNGPPLVCRRVRPWEFPAPLSSRRLEPCRNALPQPVCPGCKHFEACSDKTAACPPIQGVAAVP